MTVMLLILSVALTPVLTFAASLIGGAVGFVAALVFHALRAVVRAIFKRAFSHFRNAKAT